MAAGNEPGIRDAHVDALLTQMSLAVMNEPSAYVAMQVFPRVPVRKQSAIIPKYDYRAWLADEAEIRAPGGESSGSGWELDNTNKYNCENWAHHTDIPDEIVANEDDPYDAYRDGTMFVFDKIMMRIDRLFVLKYMKSGAWSTDIDMSAAGNTQWTASNALPVKDMETAQITLEGLIARPGNRMVLAREAYGGLKENANVIDRIKHVQKGVVTKDLLQSLFELDALAIPGAIYASNKRGATLARARIWPKHSLLLYAPPRPALMRPSAGYSFQWNFLPRHPVYTRRMYLSLKKSTRIESHAYLDMKQTSADAGYMFIKLAA